MNKLLVAFALLVSGASVFAATAPTNTVPEPGTLLMVALAGVIGVVARRGRK